MTYRVSDAFWDWLYAEHISARKLSRMTGIPASTIDYARRTENALVPDAFVNAITDALIFPTDALFFAPVEKTDEVAERSDALIEKA